MKQVVQFAESETPRRPVLASVTKAPRSEARGCVDCLARKLALCEGLEESQPDSPSRKSFQRVPARRMIYHPREHSDAVSFICTGWAVALVGAPEGGRQITSVLLPGDTISVGGLLEQSRTRTVEAVTDVLYRQIPFNEFKRVITARPDAVFSILKQISREREASDQLALHLGRRNSDQRIARLLLDLHARLSENEVVDDTSSIEFPLRQRQIADATGLTPVHVCKVLGAFTDAGHIEISDRSLRILDFPALQRIAG